jgi:DNA-binding response OmpR family regulator
MSRPAARILIIEDQLELARGLEINLSREGYQVLCATTGEEGLLIAEREQPDLVLLDLMLPGIGGLDVCRELRTGGSAVPVIMLTAKSAIPDRVVGLELGADDYVTKPFSLAELLARIHALLRRSPAKEAESPQRYRAGDVEIDFELLTVTRNDQAVSLTAKEGELLHLLVRSRGRTVDRSRMLKEVWGYDPTSTTRTVDTHILNLRHKIEDDPARPRHILTVYGEGYRFVG